MTNNEIYALIGGTAIGLVLGVLVANRYEPITVDSPIGSDMTGRFNSLTGEACVFRPN